MISTSRRVAAVGSGRRPGASDMVVAEVAAAPLSPLDLLALIAARAIELFKLRS